MKELHGLKVKAIAVEVPEYAVYNIKKIPTSGGYGLVLEVVSHNNLFATKNTPHTYLIALPPGSWKILGRANELFVTKSCNYGILDFLPEHGWRDYEDKTPDAWCMKTQTQSWQSYCSEHGLTNELILIESA